MNAIRVFSGQKWWFRSLFLLTLCVISSCCYSLPRREISLSSTTSPQSRLCSYSQSSSGGMFLSLPHPPLSPLGALDQDILPPRHLVHGAERMELLLPLLQNKRVALLINQTSVVGINQTSLLDTLLARGVEIRKVFVPEHGFRGNIDAGKKVKDSSDPQTGISIISLYGRTKKPTADHLSDVDIIVFDMQDVGCRFYTYISTMHYAMEAAAEQGKEFVVCDRPNPNDYIAGPILEDNCRSFIGLHPIPILHGMTIGELAMMINGEGWLGQDTQTHKLKKCRLSVIPTMGWKHGDPYSLPIPPSPNLPNDLAIKYYPSICLFEATIMSVGRGTTHPFQCLGYPSKVFGSFVFTPRPIKGADSDPVLNGRRCYGIDLRTQGFLGGLSLEWLVQYHKIAKANGLSLINRPRTFELIAGNKTLARQLAEGLSPQKIEASWQQGIEQFKVKRLKYLLYSDQEAK